MEDTSVKIKGGVVGAKRILAVVSASEAPDDVRECLKELFLYELANDMRGSNRYKPEYEKRIGRYADQALKAEKKLNS
jgi:hypothetical protein